MPIREDNITPRSRRQSTPYQSPKIEVHPMYEVPGSQARFFLQDSVLCFLQCHTVNVQQNIVVQCVVDYVCVCVCAYSAVRCCCPTQQYCCGCAIDARSGVMPPLIRLLSIAVAAVFWFGFGWFWFQKSHGSPWVLFISTRDSEDETISRKTEPVAPRT